MGDRLSLELDASVQGADKVDQLGTSIQRVINISEIAAMRAAASTSAFASSIEVSSSKALKGAEGIAALAASHELYAAALAKYSAGALSGASSTETLVNSYRGLRIALSPTQFTVATVAIGILTEETVRLTMARARLIEQQATFSAISRLPISSVERIGASASLSNGNATTLQTLGGVLASRGQSSALTTLGISAEDPEILAKVARGFDSIADPVQRANTAVKLFGAEHAGEALRELTLSFAAGSDAVQRFGLVLDSTSRTQIFQFREDMRHLGGALDDVKSNFKGAWQAGEQFAEVLGSSVEDGVKRGAKAVDDWIAKVTHLRGALAPLQTLPAGSSLGRTSNDTQLGLTADDMFAQSQASKFRQSQTIAGRRAAEDAAREQADSAYRKLAEDQARRQADPNDPGLLTGSQRFVLAAQQQSKAALANVLGEQAKAMEKAKQDADDAAKRADDLLTRATRAQSSGLLSSREILARSNFDSTAGRDLADNIRKDSTFTDSDGEIHSVKMLDETRRDLAAAFSTYVIELSRKTGVAQLAQEEEAFARRKGFEDALFRDRLRFSIETGAMERETTDRTFSHQSDSLDAVRDERLKRVDVGSAGLSGSDAATAGISNTSARLRIESQYLLDKGIAAADSVERERSRLQQDLAVARYTGKIGDSDYFSRSQAINDSAGEKGTEINDSYAHNLLMAQQDAVIETTRIIKDLENQQMERFKSVAGGLFDAVVSRQPRAIPDFVKSQGLGVARTIAENLSGELFKSIKGAIPHAGSGTLLGRALQGTPFGPDPLKSATDANTQATIDNTAAIRARGSATSGSYGGSSSGDFGDLPLSSIPPGFSLSSLAPGVPSALSSTASMALGPVAALARLSGSSALGNFGSGASSALSGYALSVASDPGFNLSTRIGAGVGLAGELATGGYQIYSGLKQGGVGGDLKAAGSAAGVAGSIVSNVSKLMSAAGPLLDAVPIVGSIAALALPLLGGLFNGPQRRENAINQELGSSQYNAPTALNVTQSSGGSFLDFNAKGQLRQSNFSPYPQVSEAFTWQQTHGLFGPAPTYYNVPGGQTSQFGAPASTASVTINHNYAPGAISTIGPQDFRALLDQHHADVGNAAAKSLQQSHGSLATEIDRKVNR